MTISPYSYGIHRIESDSPSHQQENWLRHKRKITIENNEEKKNRKVENNKNRDINFSNFIEKDKSPLISKP